MRRYELTDSEWERIKSFFPEKPEGSPGRPPKDTRPILNGVIWLARSGAPWRDLPERYGPWQTVYTRFQEWLKSGIIEKIFAALSIDADMETLSLDSTSIRVHQHGTGAKKGANLPKSGVPEED